MEPTDRNGGHILLRRPAWAGGHVALVFRMWVTLMAALMRPGGVSLALAAWR